MDTQKLKEFRAVSVSVPVPVPGPVTSTEKWHAVPGGYRLQNTSDSIEFKEYRKVACSTWRLKITKYQ